MANTTTFSEMIRRFRLDNQLSQDELAQLISEHSLAERAIDITTVSRWEREKNRPSLPNQIAILRKLGIAFSVRHLQSREKAQEGVEILKARYHRFGPLSDKPYRDSLPSFTLQSLSSIKDFLSDDALMKFTHTSSGADLSEPKLSEYLSNIPELDIRVDKFYSAGELKGHFSYAVAETSQVRKFLELANQCQLTAFFPARRETSRTLINFSSYASDFFLYLYKAFRICSTVEQDLSVDWVISNSFIHDDWLVHKGLGASVLLRGEAVDSGGIKIGKGHYRNILCLHDANVLLSTSIAAITQDEMAQYGKMVY